MDDAYKLRRKLKKMSLLRLGPWIKSIHPGFSRYGGQTGRSWTRRWFWGKTDAGQAAMVVLNGDGIEVRSRISSPQVYPAINCDWTNHNGVSKSKWPNPKGFRWCFGGKVSDAEYMATLEREMDKQRKAADKLLTKAILGRKYGITQT